MDLSYLPGFGHQRQSEALPGVLTEDQNWPQMPAYELYPQQLSGAFSIIYRALDQHLWLCSIYSTLINVSFEEAPGRDLSDLKGLIDNLTPRK